MTKLNKNINKLDSMLALDKVSTRKLCMLQKIKRVGMTIKNNSNGKIEFQKNNNINNLIEQAEQGQAYFGYKPQKTVNYMIKIFCFFTSLVCFKQNSFTSLT